MASEKTKLKANEIFHLIVKVKFYIRYFSEDKGICNSVRSIFTLTPTNSLS